MTRHSNEASLEVGLKTIKTGCTPADSPLDIGWEQKKAPLPADSPLDVGLEQVKKRRHPGRQFPGGRFRNFIDRLHSSLTVLWK